MAIFLSAYGNRNYRSLGGDGVVLDGLKDINIIIGQNNGGKTNILRSLEVWESSRRGKPINLDNKDYYENDSSNPVEFEFVFPDEELGNLSEVLISSSRPFIRLRMSGPGQYGVIDSFVRQAEDNSLQAYCTSHYHTSSSDKNQNIQMIERQADFDGLLAKVPPIIYVTEQRNAHPGAVKRKLAPIWNHGAGDRSMIPVRKALKDFIEEGVESKIELRIQENKDSFTIDMNNELVEFESLGSGFKQIFDVALTIASIQDSIVLIDEPELNMHPNLLRRLMKLIFANGSNQYIICTHSNILLDASYEKSVFRVIGGKSSVIEKCDTVEETRDLLDDLGVKASDILQSNGIIWVEGPSDRSYIKKWLELNNSKMEEGLDYSFQYYGGKLLAHYTVDDDIKEFVNILDVNRNAFIVMDSDWKIAGRKWAHTDLADRKKRIIDSCKQKGIPYWVTTGREIENYISDSTWSAYEGAPIELALNDAISEKSSKYKIKAKSAHEVVAHITKEEFEANEDLKSHIDKLDSTIQEWNQQQ